MAARSKQQDGWRTIPGDTPVEQVVEAMTAEPKRKRKTKAKTKPKGRGRTSVELQPERTETAPREQQRSVGRPSDYDPSFCERVLAWGKEGKSRTWMAAKLDVCRDTLYEWMGQHPEFSDALTRAKQHEQAYWEDLGHDNLTKPNFSQNCWGRNMASRFPEDWRESKDVRHGVTDELGALLERIDGKTRGLPET